MTINVLVNGAFGRMGQLVTKAVRDEPELELVGQTGREYDLKRAIIDSGAQVVIDFTHPDSVYGNTVDIITAGAHPVVGTSGLKKDQIIQLQTMCEQIKRGGLIVPNFSMGAVLMMKCAKEIAAHLSDVEIIEMHHANKVDSPSGTAIRTAELIAQGRQLSPVQEERKTSLNQTRHQARGMNYDGVPIHSVRLSGVLASQTVIFGGIGETLSIHHESIQRESFMPGVCYACKKVVSLHRLVYGLEEIL